MKKRLLVLASVFMLCGIQQAEAHDFWQWIKATATVTATDTTPVAITGLSFDVAASQLYSFRCYFVSHTTTNTTSGVQYTLTGPANPTSVTLMVETPDAAGTGIAVQHYFGTGATGYTGFVPNQTNSLTTFHIERMTGLLNNSTAGTVQFLINSENTDDAVVGTGSWCEIETPRPTINYTPQG